jgi:hypothetical protein
MRIYSCIDLTMFATLMIRANELYGNSLQVQLSCLLLCASIWPISMCKYGTFLMCPHPYGAVPWRVHTALLWAVVIPETPTFGGLCSRDYSSQRTK